MLGRKEEGGRKKAQVEEAVAARDLPYNSTITTTSGQVLTISEFLSRFDEVAKRRLDSMNQKLRNLEMQMEALEAEVSKAND